MSEDQLVARSRRVVLDQAVIPASIHIRGGRILRIGSLEDAGDGEPEVDFGNHVVMPGLVDSHVHVNEPGRTAWEGFESATRAAAAGGITTIVDMPLNSIPATTTVNALEAKLRVLEGKCHVDVGLWGGAVPGNSRELAPLLRAGVLGFKAFLVDSGVEEFRHLTEEDLRTTLDVLGRTNAPLLVHAESPGVLAEVSGPARSQAYAGYLSSRPARAEDEAIELLYAMIKSGPARIHVAHLSSAGALSSLRRARDEGVTLTAETTPHYLHFTAEQIPDRATEYKCAPPIREASNREQLWDALRDGLIGCVVSDHSPCTADLKRFDEGDFLSAWGGIASLQLLLPVIWTETERRGFPIWMLSRWLSSGPADLAGLSSRKGGFAPGMDADFVVWDPESSFIVDPLRLEHKNKVTPYRGEELRGVVKATYLRGVEVFSERGFGARRGEWLRGTRS
ncbi:MAG TPA: allantoinase AllB [Thermoanaerobaculia bacterium]|nr:allantoinase AllB [Thermoanaerobaculia bacterium]